MVSREGGSFGMMERGIEDLESGIALTSEEMSMLGGALSTKGLHKQEEYKQEEYKQESLELARDVDGVVVESLEENRRMRVRVYYVVGAKTASEGLTRVTSDRVGRERLETLLSGFEGLSAVEMTDVSVNDLGELDRARRERYGLKKGESLYEVAYAYEMDVKWVGDTERAELDLTHRLMEWMVDEGAVAVFDYVIVGRLS